MFEQVNKVLKNIFSNEETIIFFVSNIIIFSSYIILRINLNTFYDKHSCCLSVSHAKKFSHMMLVQMLH